MPRRSEGVGSFFLLDTNVVSELRKGPRCQASVAAWSRRVPPVACHLSRVTLAEIVFGIEQVDDAAFQAELEAWLEHGVRAWFGRRILDVDEAVLLVWRRLAQRTRRAGQTMSKPDGLIAATALAHGLTVVTRNVADFLPAGVALFNPWDGA